MKQTNIYDYIEEIINSVLLAKKTYMSPKEIWNYAMSNSYFDSNYIKTFPDSSRKIIMLKGGTSCVADIINKNQKGLYINSSVYHDKYTLKEVDSYLKTNKITLQELIIKVLSSVNYPLTQNEIWNKAIELNLNNSIVLCNSPEREILNYIYDDIRDYKDESAFVKIKNIGEPIKFGLSSISYKDNISNTNSKIVNTAQVIENIISNYDDIDENNFLYKLLKEIEKLDINNTYLKDILINFNNLNNNINEICSKENSQCLSILLKEFNSIIEYFNANNIDLNNNSIDNDSTTCNTIYNTKKEEVIKPLGYLLYRMEQINKSLIPISVHIDNEEIYASNWKDIFVRTLRFICTNKNINIDKLICSNDYTINNIECFSDMQLDIDYYEEIVDELYFYNEFDDEDIIYLFKKILLDFNYNLENINICCEYNI